MDFSALADLLNLAVSSKAGTVVAAAVLSLLMWLLTKVPVVSDLVSKDAVVNKIVMVFLAVAPAVVTSLTSKSSW